MSLKRFFAYSVALHTLIIFAIIASIPAVKHKKPGNEFFIGLISPEEFPSRKSVSPPATKTRPLPDTRKETSRSVSPESSEKSEMSPAKSGQVPSGKEKLGEKPSDRIVSPLPDAPPVPSAPAPSLREKLFDRNVIGDIARKKLEKTEEEKRDTTFTFDAKEYRFLIYNKRLKERIESIWIYPPDAATKGIYGDLIIKFSIKKNGSLGDIEVVRTSGHKSLDDAAIKALKDGAPYWPLPEEWGIETYTIVGHFIYTIYGYYIR